MRIAVTADPYIPVPPKIYGGIERIVGLLVEGLARAGHDVVLIGHPESEVGCELVPYGAPPHKGVVPRITELYQVGSWLFRHRGELDIVHSFGRLAALFPILPFSYLPKFQTYQRPEIPWTGVARASGLAGASISFTGCSSAMYKNPKAGQWHTVYNAVDVDRYDYVAELPVDAPLMFLGRIEPIKGTHDAIQIALQSGRDLIVVGNRVDDYSDYFEQKVEPLIDGKQIRYVGAVDDRQKNELLGRASALLMPIDIDEVFGSSWRRRWLAARRSSVSRVAVCQRSSAKARRASSFKTSPKRSMWFSAFRRCHARRRDATPKSGSARKRCCAVISSCTTLSSRSLAAPSPTPPFPRPRSRR